MLCVFLVGLNPVDTVPTVPVQGTPDQPVQRTAGGASARQAFLVSPAPWLVTVLSGGRSGCLEEEGKASCVTLALST